MSDLVSAPVPAASAAEAPGLAVRHILWACDFSGCSAGALRAVIPLARAFGSDVTALHVMPTTIPPGAGAAFLTNPALLHPHLHHDVSISLNRFVGPAIEASVSTRIALREGKAVDEVLAVAGSLPADLIAVGTHGKRLLERSVLGSVAEGILGRAKCPVLAMPTAARPLSGGGFETVLWATDFSSHSARAQEWVVAIVKKTHARLVLLHVVEDDTVTTDAERLQEAEERIQEAAAACRGAGCSAETIVTMGNAARDVLRIARDRGADLIVMGVEGPHTMHRLLFGSTTHRVVRDAPCAVLAVPRA